MKAACGSSSFCGTGELCACELIERLDMGQSTLSYHMKILCESGIVINRQEGKWAHYRISGEVGENVIAYLRELTSPHGNQTNRGPGCACGGR